MAEGDTVVTQTVAPPPGTPWFQGKVDADVISHWQQKGYDVNDPVKVSTELTKAYRSAEQMLGRPRDQLVYVPADMVKEPEAVKAAFQRLGAPLDPKDYDFPSLTDKDGKITDTRLADMLRTVAGEVHLPKSAADKFAAAILKHQAAVGTADSAGVAAKVTEARNTLAKNWGVTPDKLSIAPNMVVAQRAAATLKIPPEAISALESQIGYAAVMEMFREIGSRMGEDTFVRPGGGESNKIASVDQAKARKSELFKDTAWIGRHNNGDRAAIKEMYDLNVIIAGAEEDRL